MPKDTGDWCKSVKRLAYRYKRHVAKKREGRCSVLPPKEQRTCVSLMREAHQWFGNAMRWADQEKCEKAMGELAEAAYDLGQVSGMVDQRRS